MIVTCIYACVYKFGRCIEEQHVVDVLKTKVKIEEEEEAEEEEEDNDDCTTIIIDDGDDDI